MRRELVGCALALACALGCGPAEEGAVGTAPVSVGATSPGGQAGGVGGSDAVGGNTQSTGGFETGGESGGGGGGADAAGGAAADAGTGGLETGGSGGMLSGGTGGAGGSPSGGTGGAQTGGTGGVVVPIDSDNDGVPDSEDECPGYDDNQDLNENGEPDWCEPNWCRDPITGKTCDEKFTSAKGYCYMLNDSESADPGECVQCSTYAWDCDNDNWTRCEEFSTDGNPCL